MSSVDTLINLLKAQSALSTFCQITVLFNGSLLPGLIGFYLIAKTMVWPISQSYYCFPCSLRIFTLLLLFVITAAGVVPCGGPKKFPRTHL